MLGSLNISFSHWIVVKPLQLFKEESDGGDFHWSAAALPDCVVSAAWGKDGDLMEIFQQSGISVFFKKDGKPSRGEAFVVAQNGR